MIVFHKRDIELAKQFSINPVGMVGIRRVYETIHRFTGFTEGDIDASIREISYVYDKNKAPNYSYEKIPEAMKSLLKGIIKKNGSIREFLNSKDSELVFIYGFIQRRWQPRDFLFTGVITFPEYRRGKDKDNSVIEIEYEHLPDRVESTMAKALKA